jgi:hypothetical protein
VSGADGTELEIIVSLNSCYAECGSGAIGDHEKRAIEWNKATVKGFPSLMRATRVWQVGRGVSGKLHLELKKD